MGKQTKKTNVDGMIGISQRFAVLNRLITRDMNNNTSKKAGRHQMSAIVSSNRTVSFPDQEVSGIGTVRIMRHFEVVGRALDTPRHIREAALALGFKTGDRVIVADTYGQCRTVTI